MPNWNTDTLLTVLVAITGLSLLLQLAVLLGIFIAMRKGMKVAQEKADQFTATLKPILNTSTQILQKVKTIVESLEPKLSTAATELTQMVHIAREQTDRLQVSLEEINQRTRRQAVRVDGMTTSLLNGLDRAGHMVNEAVNIPVRQVSGIIAAAKAVVDTLRAPAPPRRHVPESPASDEKDLFV